MATQEMDEVQEKMADWLEFGLNDSIIKSLYDSKFYSPTEIQRMSIRSGTNYSNNVIISAKTGSGKTLCFLIPTLNYLLENYPNEEEKPKSVKCIILTPTRELAVQIAEHYKFISKHCKFSMLALVGGMSIQKQRRLLNTKHPDIVVGTPGRLWDLFNDSETKYLQLLNEMRFLVFDEADRMIERGHYPELRRILNHLYNYIPKEAHQLSDEIKEKCDIFSESNQQLFSVGTKGGDANGKNYEVLKNAKDLMSDFYCDVEDANFDSQYKEAEKANKKKFQIFLVSATLTMKDNARTFKRDKKPNKGKKQTTDRLEKLVEMVQLHSKPDVIDLTSSEKVPEKLQQYKIGCQIDEKDYYLYYFIEANINSSMIVFVNTITCCRKLLSTFRVLNIPVLGLHSSMNQKQRLTSLEEFKSPDSSKKKILICTDVAARGIDLPRVEFVFHYQFPLNTELYLHRCGRTARHQEDGTSVLIVTPEEFGPFKEVCRYLDRQDLPPLEMDQRRVRSIRQLVDTANKVEKKNFEKKSNKMRVNWFTKTAEQCDIIPDEDVVEEEQLNGPKVDPDQGHVRKIREKHEMNTLKHDLREEMENFDFPIFSKSAFLTPEMVSKLNEYRAVMKKSSKKEMIKQGVKDGKKQKQKLQNQKEPKKNSRRGRKRQKAR